MTELLFEFKDITDEIDAFSKLSERFMAAESRDVLERYKRNLQAYRDDKGEQAVDWEISQSLPLRTEPTNGYEKFPKAGKHLAVAEISSIWRIKKVPSSKKSIAPKYFKLVGIASTQIRVTSNALNQEPEEFAMWRMEIGDAKSPGCHFHVQVLGHQDAPPFPKSLSVPRLPSLILTVPAVAEFVLAEFFQDEWPKEVGRASVDLERWAAIQNKRWEQLLQWKLGLIGRGGSPWTTIKSEKPSPNLFVPNGN